METVGEVDDLDSCNWKFTSFCLSRASFYANYVSSSDGCSNLVPVWVRLVELGFIGVDLYFLIVALDVVEMKALTSISDSEDSTCDSDYFLEEDIVLWGLFEFRD